MIGVTQLEALRSLGAGRQDAGVPRQLRNAYIKKHLTDSRKLHFSDKTTMLVQSGLSKTVNQ